MRWEKDGAYVEIASGISAEGQGAVLHIESNLGPDDLPIEFRATVSKTDEEGCENLERIVSSWAERKGFQRISDD